MHIEILPVPVKIVEIIDYSAIVEYVKTHGNMILPADINANSFHSVLYKHGLGVRQVAIGGKLLAHSVQPLRKSKAKQSKGAQP